MTCVEDILNSGFDGVCLGLETERVAQHHRARQDGRDRVRDALARDVRRGAVDRLIHTLAALIHRGGRQHTDGAGDHGSLIGQNIAEQVAGYDNVELTRIADELHRAVVNIHIGVLDLRVLVLDAVHGFAPYAAGFEHVCLVYRADLLIALHRHFKGTAADALYLINRVVHVVRAGLAPALVAFAAVMLAEVNVAGQLTANENVEAVTDDLGLDRARIRKCLVHLRRAQVDEQTQCGAQTEQRLLRTLGTRHIVPLRAAYRAEQNGIRVLTDLDGFIGQRDAVLVDRAAACEDFLKLKLVAELFADLIEHEHSLGYDLRADAVTLDNSNIVFHGIMPLSP